MTITTLLIQLLFTIPLTILMNYCKRKENNRINEIILPTIYIILISALIPSIKNNVFLIVIFEVFIRNFYLSTIESNNRLESYGLFIIDAIISVALSLFTYNYLIANVSSLIPDPEEILPFLWFIISVYIIYLYTKFSKNKKVKEKQDFTVRKKEYTIMQYAKYKSKYYTLIKSKHKIVNDLIYSIMIYESYKTPKLYQKIEEYIGSITKKETRYGIMRQLSYTHLTDEQSIKMVLDTFEKEAKNSKLKEKEMLNKLLNAYKEEDKNNIIKIYYEIIEFSKK